MEITTYKDVVEQPARRKYRKGVYSDPLMEFVDSDNGTLKFSFSNKYDMTQCSSAVRQYIRKHDLNLVVWCKKNDVFVIKG